jgi:hypothetical protein
MSSPPSEAFVGDFLEHFGVRGMKWGFRKDKGNSAVPGSKSSKGDDSSDDARTAREIAIKVSKSGGTHALSNKELQTLVNRINLEQNFARTQTPTAQKTSPMKTGIDYVSGKVKKVGDMTVDSILKTAVNVNVRANENRLRIPGVGK